VRDFKREAISRGYNLLLRGTLAARFSDAQCGFKAMRSEVAAELLPHIRDTGWFFDTELLVLAERAGFRIHEVPVDWVDDPDSRVDIISTAIADLKGIARLLRGLATGTLPLGRMPAPRPSLPGQLLRFCVIGILSTAAYLGLFALLRTGLDAQPANLIALLTTAIANTAANRRLTFGVAGRRHLGRHHLQGLLVFGLGLALTSGALASVAGASLPIELSVLIMANLAATVMRFLLLRFWMHHRLA
jgi:putative flippase GtrA